ncbi:MAG: hypothetical protein DRJ42_26790 [Deltaproteobacteria bacterium]|nr:MAG: hypothetical protein DRJ42_26790 [Deltaproteobacteria bacterium]
MDGSCTVDTMADPLSQGRAFNGALYDNGLVSFTLASAVGVNYPSRGDDLVFSFVVGDTPIGLIRTAGTLLEDLQYSPADETLYSVDIGGGRGLGGFSMDPFELVQSFE